MEEIEQQLTTNGHHNYTNGESLTVFHLEHMHFDNGDPGSSSDAAGSVDSNEEGVSFGKCKWFNVLKGFGFIVPDDGTPEVFVHQSVLKMPGFRSLEEGAMVEFRCKQTNRGYEATYVGGVEGLDCEGSSVRPLGKRKHKQLRCFNCGKYGNHIAKKCKEGALPKSCYECKGEDHLVSQCPIRKEKENSSTTSDTDKNSVEVESDLSSSPPTHESN